ncbi:MAG: hypothetical protein AB8F34_14215 [Akkermansiaceae bacterium]
MMKPTLMLLVTTHVLALVAGGLLHFLTVRKSTEDKPPSPIRTSQRAQARSTADIQKSLTRRIRDHAEEDRKWNEDWDQLKSIRQLGQEAIRLQPQLDRAHEVEFRRFTALADTYKTTTNLNPAISTALVANDDDAAAAIFLELHRRDPDLAYDAMAARESLLNGETSYPIFLHLPDKELLSEALRKDRHENFSDTILYNLARKYGESDDLAALAAAMSQANVKSAELLASVFVDYWVPDNGAAAAEYLCREIPANLRVVILEQLSEGNLPGDDLFAVGSESMNAHPVFPVHPSLNSPSNAWTEDFSTALFSYNLDISKELHDKLRRVADSADLVEDDIPNPYQASIQPQSLTPGLNPQEAYERIRRHIHDALFNNKDYPELFANGSMSAAQVSDAVSKNIEGSELYSEALARAIFPYLVKQNPQKTAVWARSQISAESLSTETVSFLTNATKYDEPRTARILTMLDTFQPELSMNKKLNTLWHSFFHKYDLWRKKSPQDADRALSTINPKHPLWQEMKKRKETP